MRISDWSSDVCSSDLIAFTDLIAIGKEPGRNRSLAVVVPKVVRDRHIRHIYFSVRTCRAKAASRSLLGRTPCSSTGLKGRSEEHTSELQSLMRISYAVFCLKKKKKTHNNTKPKTN